MFADHSILWHIIDILSNDEFTPWRNFLIWLNIFFVSTALYYNYLAAKRVLFQSYKGLFSAITMLSVLYLIAYFILLLDVNYVRWSEIMSGLSLPVWYVVWILPARIALKENRKIMDELEKGIEEKLIPKIMGKEKN